MVTKMTEHKEYSLNPRDIPDALLEKYQQSGPRYTSYPTAPQFQSQFDREEVLSHWAETNRDGNGLSIYTHFPFCQTRCLFCGCFTQIGRAGQKHLDYLQGLKGEVDQVFSHIDPSRKVYQLAFGGGTPTHFTAAQLKEYVGHLRNTVEFHPEAECSIEIDPRDNVDAPYLDQLIAMGFNRFSFGVQDLNPEVQKKINRLRDEQHLADIVSYLRRSGIDAINFDLIYGLPAQTPETFAPTIEKVIQYRPSRIALYGYAHVPWIKPHQKVMEKHHMPGPSERMTIFGNSFERLLEAGYQYIGMDHFALPGDELVEALNTRTLTRNFMGYTTRRGLDLVGIGTSSISSVGMTYTQNGKDLLEYANATNGNNSNDSNDSNDSNGSNGLYWEKGLTLSPEDYLRREIILDLFCNFYLDIAAVEKRFDISFFQHFEAELEDLKPMEADQLLNIDHKELKVTPLGRYFVRNICMKFDSYLAKEKENPANRYSKTI